MKTLIILAMGIWAGSMSCLAQTSQDTTIVVNNAKKITIEKSHNSMAVKVEGTADNPDYFYSQTMEVDSSAAVIATEKNVDWDFTIPFVNKKEEDDDAPDLCDGNFGIGMVSAPKSPDNMKVDMGASYELMIDNIVKCNYYIVPNTTSISLGFGMTWRNYRLTGTTRFIKEGDNLILGGYPEGSEIKFSCVKVYSLMVPLMVNQAVGRNSVLSFGAVLNFNTHASIKTRYLLGGEKIKEASNNIHQNSKTVDFMAKLRLGKIGFYAKYSPSDVLNTAFGPEFNSFSAGVCWFFD